MRLRYIWLICIEQLDMLPCFFTEKFEALLKDDQHHLNELTRGIERQHKERMELRRVLSIEGN